MPFARPPDANSELKKLEHFSIGLFHKLPPTTGLIPYIIGRLLREYYADPKLGYEYREIPKYVSLNSPGG